MTSGFSLILRSHKCLTRKEVWPDDDSWEPSRPPHGNLPCMSSQKPKMLPWRGRTDRRSDHLWWSVGRWLHGATRRQSCEIHLKGQKKAGLAHHPETKTPRSVSKPRGSLVSGWAQQGSGGRSRSAAAEGFTSKLFFQLTLKKGFTWSKTMISPSIWTQWWYSSSNRGLYWLWSDWCIETGIMQGFLFAISSFHLYEKQGAFEVGKKRTPPLQCVH